MMKIMFKVRFVYLLFALLLLVQPIVFGHQIVQAASWVFQDDFSGPLLWSKVVGTPGPGSPQPPAVTGGIAIEGGELHVKADYWWYQVHAVRTFSGVTGDFLASARFRIMPDSGDASCADILVGTGPFSDTSNPNVLAALGTDAYYHQWVIFVQGVEVKRISATVPKDTWVQVGIGCTAGVLRFMVDGTAVFQCPAPPSPAIDRMALGTSIGIHWEGGPHAHFDDAAFFVGSTPSDTTPPAAITDLSVQEVTTDSVTLTWTAPGDDGNAGRATNYDVRYSSSQVTQANWASATQATGEPSPKATGSTETFIVTGLQAGKTYYFALKTVDEVPNWSGLSNAVSGTTTKGLTDADWLRILETAQNNTQTYSHDRSKVFNSDWWHQVADGLADAESDLWNPLESSAKSVFKMLLPQVFESLTLFDDAYEITKDLVYCGSVMLYDNVCAAVGAANALTGNAVPRDLDDLLATEASLIAASQAHDHAALESGLLQEKRHTEQLYGDLAWFDRELYSLCLDETRMGAEGLARNTYNPLRRHIVALRTSLEGTYRYTTYLLGEERDLSGVGAQLDARNCEPLVIEAYWEVNGQKVTTVPKDTTVNVHVVVKPRDSSRYDPGSFSGNIVVEIRQDWLGLDEPYGSANFDITKPITGDQTEHLQLAFVPKQSSSFLLHGYFIRAKYSGNDAFLRYQEDQSVYFVTESSGLSKEMENSYPPRLKVTGSSASFAVYSPANLMVTDPLGRRVGFDPATNSTLMEIPGAWYSGTSLEPQAVTIPDPLDGYYSTLLVGTSTGTYSLISELIPIEGGTTTFAADNIPTAVGSRHQYTVDWEALAEGEAGVTIQVDSDGDGTFECALTSGSELTSDEFITKTTPVQRATNWSLVLGIITAAVLVGLLLFFLLKRRAAQK
jgi:hypothetical protein